MHQHLSPKELSLIINVSESSIKRWVDKGEISADISDGGHRHIGVNQAIQFIRQKRMSVFRADLLGFPDVNYLLNESSTNELNPDCFFNYLINSEVEKARGYLLKLYLQGYSVSEICDTVVAAAMNRIGEMWMRNESGICLEHHATDICIQAVNSLRSVFRSNQKAPVALGGTLEGDPYMIPSLCIASVLMAEGYQTVNLGPNTPVSTFEHAIDQFKPELVWFSITAVNLPKRLLKVLEAYVQYLNTKNINIVFGGRSSSQYKFLQDCGAFWGANMAELTAYLKGLKIARE